MSVFTRKIASPKSSGSIYNACGIPIGGDVEVKSSVSVHDTIEFTLAAATAVLYPHISDK